MLKSRLYVGAMIACLLAGVVGVPIATQIGCDPVFVMDTETGLIREATPEEADGFRVAVTEQAVQTGQAISVATGHPELVPLIGLAGQLALALTALFINRKRDALPQVPAKVAVADPSAG